MWAYVQRLDADPFEGLDSNRRSHLLLCGVYCGVCRQSDPPPRGTHGDDKAGVGSVEDRRQEVTPERALLPLLNVSVVVALEPGLSERPHPTLGHVAQDLTPLLGLRSSNPRGRARRRPPAREAGQVGRGACPASGA